MIKEQIFLIPGTIIGNLYQCLASRVSDNYKFPLASFLLDICCLNEYFSSQLKPIYLSISFYNFTNWDIKIYEII